MLHLYIPIILSFFLSVTSERWYSATVQNEMYLKSKTDIESGPKFNKIENVTKSYITDHTSNSTSVKSDFQSLSSTGVPAFLRNQPRVRNEISLRKNTEPNIRLTNTRQFRSRRKNFGASNKTVQGRFLEVFEVVAFDHVPCTSINGLEGTCLHEYDCHKAGGKNMGICADGYGTCCVVLFGCDSESAASSGWFTNPEFPLPNTDRLSCTITLYKTSQNIKQLRLDFLNFEILPPTAGNCEEDQFIVTGQNVNNVIPILCGINTGQHVYIEVGNVKGSVKISFQTVTAESRLFSIKVTQLTRDHELAAPAGCLQYFKDTQGHLESFNYRDRSEIVVGNTQSYLNNLNYAICIERQPDACSVTYNNVGRMQILNYDTDGLPILPPRQAGVEIFNCPSDWLLISAVRLCGERLNDGSVLQDFSLDATVTDDGVGPIVVWFRSDSVYTGRGFKLHFQQNSCSIPL